MRTCGASGTKGGVVRMTSSMKASQGRTKCYYNDLSFPTIESYLSGYEGSVGGL